MKTAFVGGATGYTGLALVELLVHNGFRAIAHVRSDSPRLAEWQQHFAAAGALTDTTPWNLDALAATFARVQLDIVFALLGTTRARAARDAAQGRDSSYQAVDYGLTHLLIEATRRGAPHARFVYLSAIGTSPGTRNPYLAVRWKIEQELKASGLDFIAARPSLITGPDRAEYRRTERIAGVVLDGVLRVIGMLGGRTLRDRYGAITGRELAHALNAAALTAPAGAVLDTADLRGLREAGSGTDNG